jgi:hypothetical protein
MKIPLYQIVSCPSRDRAGVLVSQKALLKKSSLRLGKMRRIERTGGRWLVGWRMSDSAPLYACIILAVGLVAAITILVFLIKSIVALV